jgi:hypothetical protein
MLRQRGGGVASDSGDIGRGLRTRELVGTMPLWHRHGTVAARRRVAWRMAPGGDGALTSGPGTEREKLTVGTRMTDNSRIKNTPKTKIAQK